MTSPIVNLAALEPLYAPHEEPNFHRIRVKKEGEPAEVQRGRRPSPIVIANNLRSVVKEWRETEYAGASDTTRELLYHWFGRDHIVETRSGERLPFRYYFCQREAIETLIFLYEVRGIRCLSGLVAEFGGPDRERAAMGVSPDQDRWARYAFKVATGAGKTKVMSLAMVWSYFHALRESDSPMAKHFVVVAPNLTVFERLKEDFGDGRIFVTDPLIPVAWLGDWNMSIVLQDEVSGAATGGTVYLTNIHRLYDTSKRRKQEAETYDFMGPPVSRAKALDTGQVLRERITDHERIMVLNDEAHHLWDPGSAWSEATAFLHDAIEQKCGGGLVAQLDFSATPKDNHGQVFQHVIVDTPLGEAVDAGIVKTPVIGRGEGLKHRASNNASERFEQHLMMGYQRWLRSKEEWSKSGKKPLMFVMAEDTEAADQIARRLNGDPLFAELNGKTINLHTNLKGKVKWVGGRKNGYPAFVENETEISDEDLKALRDLSRALDSGQSPYQCIVSVLMLREGWDVKNVTTIVPLRPYTSSANILPEQTLGRGLRRMTQPGEVAELVTVVEHSAFVSLYRQELSQEGLPVEVVDVDKVPRTTVTVYPDESNKDCSRLDIVLPEVSAGYTRTATLENLTIDDVKAAFGKFARLPLEGARTGEIEYEGRHLFTNEIVERMKLRLPLLENGLGAISYYREELEHICGLRGTHKVLAALLEEFITGILLERPVTLFDPAVISRLADSDVAEHVRAVFVPLIRERTTFSTERRPRGEGTGVRGWKPYQATHSESHPAVPAERMLFNLAPCNRAFEVAMVDFLDVAEDVRAFFKNAGPQALRIDYLGVSGRLSLYTPDFVARIGAKEYVLIETKGQVDIDVPRKAQAAIAWCEAVSDAGVSWTYLYVPQEVFERFGEKRLKALVRACEPSLQALLKQPTVKQLKIPFGEPETPLEVAAFIGPDAFKELPSRYQKAIQQAGTLYQFMVSKRDVTFSPAFTPLLGPLDEAAKGLIVRLLQGDVPEERNAQRAFFRPELDALPDGEANFHRRQASNLERTLIYQNGLMPLGLLSWCLDYAASTRPQVGGVFQAVRTRFETLAQGELPGVVRSTYDFRNKYIAHQEGELTDPDVARTALAEWAKALHAVWACR